MKILVKRWFETHGAPKDVPSDEDVRIAMDTGSYKLVLDALNVQATTGVPYTHTCNPGTERHHRVVKRNERILMKQERTKHWVRILQ